MKKLSIFLFSMLIAITGFCYTVSDKIALEKVYSERVERVLENIIGKGKVFVYINLELDSMQRQEQRETYTYINANGSGGRPETAKKWLFEEKNSGPAQYYLPGYPVEGGQARQPVNPEMREKIIKQTTDVPGTVIKRADVTILIEPGVKEDIVKSIPRTTAGLLGLSKARGDTIAVRRIPFPPPSQTFV